MSRCKVDEGMVVNIVLAKQTSANLVIVRRGDSDMPHRHDAEVLQYG